MVKVKGLWLAAVAMLVATIVFPTYPPSAHANQAPFGTEIIVRTVNQFQTVHDVTAFIQKAVLYNVDVISLNVKQDEDDEVPSGHVFYDSAIAPVAPGYESFDVLEEVIAQAHQNGIEVRAWIPQFHDQVAFNLDPDWRMHALVGGAAVPFTGSNGNEYFVNPIHPDVQAYQRSIIAEVVANYDVDGVVLDWLRFDDYNMDVSPYTVNLYESIYGYSPLSINFAVNSPRRNEWNEWRTDRIGAYVQDVRDDINLIKPGLKLGVYILPPEFVEVGQDVSKFNQAVDYVAPMAYFDDWGFNAEWVYGPNGILSDTAALAGPGVAIVPTLDDDWTMSEYMQIYGGIRDHYPQVTHLSFFSYGAWSESVLSDIDARRSWPVPQDYESNVPAGWKSRNIGLQPGNVVYGGGAYTLSSSGTDIWGSSDAFNYVYRPLQGDGTIAVRVASMSQMNAWAKAGIMIRESLAPDARHADMMMTPANGATFQYRSAVQGSTSDQTTAASLPVWLMLERNGQQFTGSISSDGVNWSVVGSTTIAMGSDVYIGLALSNPGSSPLNQAVIDQVSVSGDLPLWWNSADINSTTGSAIYNAGAFVLTSRSTDLWGNADSMRYAYLPLTGDGSIVAKVSAMSNMNSWAKAGVMIRESLNAGAKHADMLMTPGNGATFQYRETTGGSTADAVTAASLPYWVKLERTGNLFVGYISPDGINWSEAGRRTISMNSNVLIGLALSNPGGAANNQAIFEHVAVVR